MSIDRAVPLPAAAENHPRVFYDALLDSLADGVLAISPDQRIELLNATGAAILGCDASTVGSTLIEAFLHDEENDAFVDAILAALAKDGSITSMVVDYKRGGEPCRLAVSSTRYRPRDEAQRGKLGIVVTFNDVTEMLRLRSAETALQEEIAAEHGKLQAAYVKLEEAAEQERRVRARAGLIRNLAIAGIMALFVGIGLYNVRMFGFNIGTTTTPPTESRDTITVEAKPVTSRVSVVGVVDAGSMVSVVGPFDGVVKEMHFEYGGSVDRGQMLVKLDTSETQVRLREAEGATIKARQHVAELQNWDKGLDVVRARRAVASAEMDTTNLTNRVTQTKLLLNKGIVAADEYTQLVQQQHTQAIQLQSAREDLNVALERGSDENRRVAEYELLNAQAKEDELTADLSRAEVEAPVSGVVLQPPDAEGKHAERLAVGSRVARGTTMFTIGSLESFSIRAKVDEIDVNKIHAGEAAIVTGDAFDDLQLQGTVTSVAAQASGESATRSGMSSFPITVEIKGLSREQRSRVHVGMSATLSIIAYDNPAAIVVPQAAVTEQDGKKIVRVHRGGRVEDVPVTLGISTPDGVEIREGLSVGDLVETSLS